MKGRKNELPGCCGIGGCLRNDVWPDVQVGLFAYPRTCDGLRA